MTEPPLERLTRSQRRRVVVLGLLRALFSAAVLVVLYFVVPLSWIDALALRVYATVTSTRFPGDPQGRTRDVGNARATLAADGTTRR